MLPVGIVSSLGCLFCRGVMLSCKDNSFVTRLFLHQQQYQSQARIPVSQGQSTLFGTSFWYVFDHFLEFYLFDVQNSVGNIRFNTDKDDMTICCWLKLGAVFIDVVLPNDATISVEISGFLQPTKDWNQSWLNASSTCSQRRFLSTAFLFETHCLPEYVFFLLFQI